jgi:hypothetical protein
MGQVINQQKDLQYSSRPSRTVTHIQRQKQIHCLRHIIAESAARLPDVEQAQPDVLRMAAYGCLTRMHVVRLLAPKTSISAPRAYASGERPDTTTPAASWSKKHGRATMTL